MQHKQLLLERGLSLCHPSWGAWGSYEGGGGGGVEVALGVEREVVLSLSHPSFLRVLTVSYG